LQRSDELGVGRQERVVVVTLIAFWQGGRFACRSVRKRRAQHARRGDADHETGAETDGRDG
jgi:hypothetical protein